MLVQDIIRRAAFNSGVISSFNVNEVPDDIMSAGAEILSEDVIWALNCDRTIDITTICKRYESTNGEIVLCPLPIDWHGLVLGKSVSASSIWLSDPDHMTMRIHAMLEAEFGLVPADYPRDDTGTPLKLGVWCTDSIFLQIVITFDSNDTDIRSAVASKVLVYGYPVNIEFPPMRVNKVLEGTSRTPYRYLYVDEYESIDHKNETFVYCIEEYTGFTRIRMRQPSSGYKALILPVPLMITETTLSKYGEVLAPLKFKMYLEDALAARFASLYGLSTQDAMERNAAKSYNLLKKNKTQELHEQNIAIDIRNTLKRAQAYYWRPSESV